MKQLTFRGAIAPSATGMANPRELERILSASTSATNPWIKKAKKYTLRGSAAVKLEVALQEEGIWHHGEVHHGVLRHDIGNTNVSPSIILPKTVQDAVTAAIGGEQIAYTESAGMPRLRKAIAGAYRVGAEEVFFVNGVTEAVLFTALLFTNTGGNLVLTKPVYPPWVGILLLHGINVHMANRENSNSGAPNIDSVGSKFDDRTIGVVLISADNPTGLLLDMKIVEGVAELLQKHMLATRRPLFLIIDDIYLEYIPEERRNDYFAVSEKYGVPLLYMAGVDKTIGTGFHGGYLIVHVPEALGREMRAQMLEDANTVFAMYLGANTLTQYATLPYFERYETVSTELAPNFEMFNRWSAAFRESILRRNGIRYYFKPPDLPFYHWLKLPKSVPDSERFALDLVRNHGICVTPGTPFGVPDGIRVAMVRDPINPVNVGDIIVDAVHSY